MQLSQKPKGHVKEIIPDRINILDILPIEIQLEIFAHLSVPDLIPFGVVNKKWCSLIAKYLFMNSYRIARYFHHHQDHSLLWKRLNGKHELNIDRQKQLEMLNGGDGSTFPYLIRTRMVGGDGVDDNISDQREIKYLENIGPILLGNMLKTMLESIGEDSRFEDGERIVSLNLWHVNVAHFKVEFVRRVLPTFEKLTYLERLYLRCGPEVVEYSQSVSPCLNVLDFMSHMRNSFSSVREVYLSGYVGNSPDEINSIVHNLDNLEKLHISFSVEFNTNNMSVNPLEAPKSLREKLTHISLKNVPPRATRLFSVIDIFETFQNLTYFEYHEVDATSGLNINIKFDDYDKVIEKFSNTKLETLIYSPSKAHQRQLASASERQSLIEEILENISHPEFPSLFPNLKNVEIADYEVQRECKYDALSAIIYYILPKVASGELLERVHAPSDCLEIATMMNCNRNTRELKLGATPYQEQLLVQAIGYRPPRRSRSTRVVIDIFSKPFDNLQRLTFENLINLDSYILFLIGKTCQRLEYLKFSNCGFEPEFVYQNQGLETPLHIRTISITNCTGVSLVRLVNLMTCSFDSLENLVMKESTILRDSSKMLINGGVPAEMTKLHTLLCPGLQELVYRDFMDYLIKSCRFKCLSYLDVYGAVDDDFVKLCERNSSLAFVSLKVSRITNMSALRILNERGIKLRALEVENTVDNIEPLLNLSTQCTCYLTSLKLLGFKFVEDNQVEKIAGLIQSASSLHTVCLRFAKDLKVLPIFNALRGCRSLNVIIFTGMGQSDLSYDQVLDFLLTWPSLSLFHFNITPKPTSSITSQKQLVAEFKKRANSSRAPKIILPNVSNFQTETTQSTSLGGCVIS